MSNPQDDFEAARQLTAVLEKIDAKDRARIIRWALEKLGQPGLETRVGDSSNEEANRNQSATSSDTATGTAIDIKSFVISKKPKSEVQFAAVVAYYHALEAPSSERKDVISGEDLKEAARKANFSRPKNPGQTLRNAVAQGLLDKGEEAGTFCINSVGENLVAMVLSGNNDQIVPKKKRQSKKPRIQARKVTRKGSR